MGSVRVITEKDPMSHLILTLFAAMISRTLALTGGSSTPIPLMLGLVKYLVHREGLLLSLESFLYSKIKATVRFSSIYLVTNSVTN